MENLKNTLQDIQFGYLYDLDCRRLAEVRYENKGEFFSIVVPKSSVEDIPEKIFLVPENGEDPTMLLSMARVSGEESEFRDIFEGKQIRPGRDSMERQDVRADVTVAVEISSPEQKGKKRVLVKNISAGGIFFVSSEPFKLGTVFSFEIPLGGKKPVPLVGEVVHVKPMSKDVFGHGCRLLPLSADAESQIRRFVFQKLQHK